METINELSENVSNPIEYDKMTLFEMARWEALIESVNIIANKCRDKDVDFDSIELPPLVLRKYVETTCDAIYQILDKEINGPKKVSLSITLEEPVLV